MNCKTKRKSWRRLAAALLAALCLLTGSGAALAAQAAGETTTPESAASPERSASTPETAASDARFSFTVLDSDYQAPASGNIDESLFAIEADEARMPTGEVVPVLLQVADPAPGSSVTVTLSDGAVFTDSEMAADTGATYTRTFANGEQASAWMLYVRADGGFTAEATYDGLDGETLTRTISVARYHKISPFSAFSARAGEHQYHITDVTKVGGEWLITFEGEDQSYCLDEGMNGKPSASVYWTYYGTTDLLDKAVAAGCSSKLDIQRYVWAHRQEASNSGSAYVYQASEAGWQNVMTRYPPVDQPTEPEQPEEYYASWSASPQTASGSLDLSYGLNTHKIGLVTGETIDDAVFEITPAATGGSIDGGSWSLTPAGSQTVTTSGHVMDDTYHTTGGNASAHWTMHYSVSKTSGSASGNVGPFDSQEEANAAANTAQSEAVSRLQGEAQAAVDAAIASARSQLANISFTVKETSVPHGFDAYAGSTGCEQQVSVPADGSTDVTIHNEEWSVQVNIAKIDSETHQPIAADAEFAVFEWDTVEQLFIPFGGYNRYTVVRNEDGSYSVANGSSYATGSPADRTLYYTQRNEGRFLIVETQAPEGYYGDWTDIAQPGTAGQVEGKRAYSFTISKDNDGTIIDLSNDDYNADVGTADNGGTLLRTPEGNTVTVTLYDQPQEAERTYTTDSTGLANNEDSYTSTPVSGKFTNDRVIGEIVLTKADLDQAVEGADTALHGTASIEGAVYDLYAAEDILHPDGVSGVVDYSKIVDTNGNPIWHTTVLTNGGWDTDYLPVLAKDHLVASAEIQDGVLAFANLYLGKYYVVERATGLVLPLDGNGQYYVSGQYPVLDRTLQPTGEYKPLAANSRGEYTDYVYKNQYSAVAEGRALSGVKTYDGYYLSFAEGYLCDEINHYKTLTYGCESQYVIRGENHSNDAVLKSGFELRKVVSTTGPGSPAPKLEGAGFTVYRVWDLSKVDEFQKNADGTYNVQSILDAYRKDSYDSDTPKYDFTGEGAAVARMFESDADAVTDYNASLTAAYDFANGQGNGWVPTQNANEYRLSELFTNEEGVIRVTGLPYGQYLVVETTLPKDLFQADPFVITVDSAAPQSVMCQPDGSVTTPSNSYLTYNVLNEELQGYLQLIKVDAETGKPVKIADTAFQIYKIEADGTETLLEMPDPDSGSATAKTSIFYTDADGYLKTPEKLPLGRYRVVEIEGPEGFFNDEQYNVVFELTSERVWEVIGNATDDMDDYIITEEYSNHETLGQLTIRKVGNVLVGFEDGQFQYEQTNLAGAVYEIRAHGDIATGDRQGTLWYADGDLVATVTTGKEGQVDEVKFSPTRTQATYDFLTVSHNGTTGEVTITLPLGSYDITEVQAPYGFVLTNQTYTVTFGWNDQSNDVILAQTIVDHTQDGDEVYSYDIVNAADASDEQLTGQPGTIQFENARVLPVPETPEDLVDKIGVGIYKQDAETSHPLAGAVYELYTVDAIYDVNGNKLADAGTLLATSAPTDDTGFTWFDVDVPIRGEAYAGGETEPADGVWNARYNSGNYEIIETTAPSGYLLDTTPVRVSFTYPGPQVAWQVVAGEKANLATTVQITKQDLTNGQELPGALLTVTDATGKELHKWTSTTEPHIIRGLALDTEYRLTELKPAPGYAYAETITFKLQQATGEDGALLSQNDVYLLGENGEWALLEADAIVMQDDVTKVEIHKTDIVTGEELPGAHLEIHDADGNLIDEWISTDKPHSVEKLPAGDYTLTETLAPDGYAVAETVPFTVTATGDIQSVVMKDAPSFMIHKTDVGGKELEGAELVLSHDGQLVDRWTTDGTPHEVPVTGPDDALPGAVVLSDAETEQVYTLHEDAAPNGYQLAADIQFKVERRDDGYAVYYRQTGQSAWLLSDSRSLTMVDEAAPQPSPAPTPEAPAPTPAPTATPKPVFHVPQTGDSTPLLAMVLVTALAAVGFIALLVVRKDRQKDDGDPMNDPQLEPRDDMEDTHE